VTAQRKSAQKFLRLLQAAFSFDNYSKYDNLENIMETNETLVPNLADVGQKLLAHSKAAEFTAKRGLVVELFPFIFGASERLSSRAISHFLETEQGVKLSSVTINKALKNPAKNWNLFFDMIEPAARIVEKANRVPMKDFLFRRQFLSKPIKNELLNAAAKLLVGADVGQANSILREKWYVIDLEIRLKARLFLESRLQSQTSRKGT
jgi:hypothetical protein